MSLDIRECVDARISAGRRFPARKTGRRCEVQRAAMLPAVVGDHLTIVRVVITIGTHHTAPLAIPVHHAVRSAAPTVFKPMVFLPHAAAHPMRPQNVCKKRESVFLRVAKALIKRGAHFGELF